MGGNAILGFFTGLFYSKIRGMKGRSIVPQTLVVLAAYAVQAPYVFITDVYLMAMPVPIVFAILAVLLLEDMISVFICHAITYGIDIRKYLLHTLSIVKRTSVMTFPIRSSIPTFGTLHRQR